MIEGLDVSKYGGPWDFVKAIEAGIRFAFIRAGGAYLDTKKPFTDYRFAENSRKVNEVGLPAGYYWFFHPGGDPTVQADYFCNLIESTKFRLPPVLDLEYDGGLSPATITNRAATFIARVYDALGVWCLTYSRSLWLHDHTTAHPVWDQSELWIARYKPGITQPWGNSGDLHYLKPPYWDTWRFWQYSETGDATKYGGLGPPSGDDDVDLDWFNGDEDDFKAYIGEEPPAVIPEVIEVTNWKNTVLRSEPKGPMIGLVTSGTRLAVVEAVSIEGATWYNVGGAFVLASHVKVVK